MPIHTEDSITFPQRLNDQFAMHSSSSWFLKSSRDSNHIPFILEHYEKDPERCPVCHGTREHFQPAQMMTREMAQMQLYELDLKIQQLMYQTIMDSLSKPVVLDQLKKMRKFYKRKLMHLLVYDFMEVEPVKEKIRQLDETIEFREKI